MNKDDLAWWLTVILMGIGLWLLVATATPAYATEVARASMGGGATLHLEASSCPDSPDASLSYTVDKGGRMYWSCWVPLADGAVVIYADGDTFRYPYDRFTLTGAMKTYLRKNGVVLK